MAGGLSSSTSLMRSSAAVGRGSAAHRGADHRVLRTVPMIDVPVPQMVDQAVEVVRFFASLSVVAEQVVEVPTVILEDPIPQRALLRAPQLAEQLVEVPTIAGYVFAVVAVQTLGWPAARALFEQLTASPGRDTNTGQG